MELRVEFYAGFFGKSADVGFDFTEPIFKIKLLLMCYKVRNRFCFIT
jgi:hypothetical protein